MDAYGSIEPVQLDEMESVFQELQKDTSVQISGTHFASLINAYGCVAKDFDKAISVFDSIKQYPRAPPPDAVVFEAVINVIVAHKRTDLLPVYISKMVEAGVHMTAYIANFLIKGYANVGDMDQARSIFESLSNPPNGIAAPNNHAPHSPSESPEVPVMEPVYREVRFF
jgi:pentatricopeptide repeat protein